jgi:methylglutaconyl-CoA hydratase
MIDLSFNNDTATIMLNRPQNGNALNLEMVEKFIDATVKIENNKDIRFVVIGAAGRYFCTGADLHWMDNAVNLKANENLDECIKLATFYQAIFNSGKVYIVRIDGPCFGGGVGLAAVCDFVFASERAGFSFSETRLGLLPAIIAPYIINRIGKIKAKMYMLTGDTISPELALHMGLIDFLVRSDSLENEILQLTDKLRLGSPGSQKQIKSLFNALKEIYNYEHIKIKTASLTANSRVSGEGREGIKAFLEKRKPSWRA